MASMFPEADAIIAGKAPTAPDTDSPFPEADAIIKLSRTPKGAGEAPPPAEERSGWGYLQQALDGATFGKFGASSEKNKAAKAAWTKEHPQAAGAADAVGRAAPMIAIGAAASVVLPEIAGLAGMGAMARFLTGSLGKNLLTRLGSQAVAGGWQGALGAHINNLVGVNPPENVAGGGAAGALIGGPLGAVLSNPLRSNIAPAVAQRARDFMSAGGRLTPAQVPGGPSVTRAVARIARLGSGDLPRLTKSLMRTTGAGDDVPFTTAGIRGRLNEIQQELQQARSAGDLNAVRTANAQRSNAAILHDIAEASGDSGTVDPTALVQGVRAAQLAGPVQPQLNQLAGGASFMRQPGRPWTMSDVANISVPGILGADIAPRIASYVGGHLPAGLAEGASVAGGVAGAGYGAAGALMNNPLYMRLLLSGRLPTANPLVSPAQQLFGDTSAMKNIGNTATSAAGAVGRAVVTPAQGRDLSSAIDIAAQTSGLDPKYVRAIASIESDMDPGSNRGKSTQYKGLFQLGTEEWGKYGGGGNIYDAADNARGFGGIAKDNAAWFKARFGRDPTPTNIYMMHLQGRGFYENGTMTNVAGNPYPGMRGPQTPASFEAGWGAEIERRAAAMAGIQVRPGPSSAGFSSVLQPITGPGPTQDQITNAINSNDLTGSQ